MKVFVEGKNIWWQRPKIRMDENIDKERKASWLELFYDLMFVAILAELSKSLFAHLSYGGIGTFIFLFIPAWWIWNSITFYSERYEMNDIRHRIFIFLNMIPLAGIAISVQGALGGMANIFALSYIASRILLIYLWLTAGESKIERKLSNLFSAGISFSACIWVFSIFLTSPFKFYLWGIALIIEMIIPLITLKTQKQLPKISITHIPERFGLLIILAIGETVIASVNGLAAIHKITLLAALSCALGLCISFLIWWIYIDHVMYRVFKRNVWHILGWSYLHLPLAASITAVGAGILAIVSASQFIFVPSFIRWLLCGSVAFVLLIAALLGLVSENKDHHHGVIVFHKSNNRQLFIFKIVSIILILGVGIFGISLNAISLLVFLIFILMIPAIQGLHLWIKSHLVNS